MNREHKYTIDLKWTGNKGLGTDKALTYKRYHEISRGGLNIIHGSSDPSFNGDADRYNPEELLLSTIASCHMLMYLYLCALNGITVTDYTDQPVGVMLEDERGSGRFISATLNPSIKIQEADKLKESIKLHHQAHEDCFIANSINFPVTVKPKIEVG